jgi:hypothetical protein
MCWTADGVHGAVAAAAAVGCASLLQDRCQGADQQVGQAAEQQEQVDGLYLQTFYPTARLCAALRRVHSMFNV